VVQCENGYVTVSESGNANIFDNDNKKIKGLANGGNGSHRANFVKAVQSRKVLVGVIEECHSSSALCHLGNLSYLVGAEKSNPEVTEAIKASAPAAEAFGRLLDHLKMNDVDVAGTRTVLGPLLTIDAKTEMFTGGDAAVVKAANAHPLRKRVGRGAFAIAQMA